MLLSLLISLIVASLHLVFVEFLSLSLSLFFSFIFWETAVNADHGADGGSLNEFSVITADAVFNALSCGARVCVRLCVFSNLSLAFFDFFLLLLNIQSVSLFPQRGEFKHSPVQICIDSCVSRAKYLLACSDSGEAGR